MLSQNAPWILQCNFCLIGVHDIVLDILPPNYNKSNCGKLLFLTMRAKFLEYIFCIEQEEF